MVNFDPLVAEIVSLVWGTPGNFNGFRIFAALLYGTLVVGVSQTAAFNRGRHLYLAGRPSRWALAHISSMYIFLTLMDKVCQYLIFRKLTNDEKHGQRENTSSEPLLLNKNFPKCY